MSLIGVVDYVGHSRTFQVGWLTIAVMNATSTVNIDLVPGQSSSVTACVSFACSSAGLTKFNMMPQNNLVRCSLTAILVSVIQLIINAIGVGWTYVLLCGVSLLSLPLVYIAMLIGPRYRVRRQRLRQLEQEAAQREEDAHGDEEKK